MGDSVVRRGGLEVLGVSIGATKGADVAQAEVESKLSVSDKSSRAGCGGSTGIGVEVSAARDLSSWSIESSPRILRGC